MRSGKIQQVIRGQTEDERKGGKKQKIILSISAGKYCALKDIPFPAQVDHSGSSDINRLLSFGQPEKYKRFTCMKALKKEKGTLRCLT